jgi:hypothetical protein
MSVLFPGCTIHLKKEMFFCNETPLHFYAAHDIIKKVSPETLLAIYRIKEAVSIAFPLELSILRSI